MVYAPSNRQMLRLVLFDEINAPQFNEFNQTTHLADPLHNLLSMRRQLHLIRQFDRLDVVTVCKKLAGNSFRLTFITLRNHINDRGR